MRGASNPDGRTAAPGSLPATRARGRNDGQGIGSLVSACRLGGEARFVMFQRTRHFAPRFRPWDASRAAFGRGRYSLERRPGACRLFMALHDGRAAISDDRRALNATRRANGLNSMAEQSNKPPNGAGSADSPTPEGFLSDVIWMASAFWVSRQRNKLLMLAGGARRGRRGHGLHADQAQFLEPPILQCADQQGHARLPRHSLASSARSRAYCSFSTWRRCGSIRAPKSSCAKAW